uniref:Uncharacterized protein n=1 Tax=Lotharella oceanica TaxID=641309 RepID=A0A7S2TFP6_9EUKA|mmetsp:Transcript_12010/g.23125  ORF Transcript_12010/g.23125 Transcript_12010/m.23125 type:complete len:104 (+) Transcript_12010:258-569(+)
MADLWQTSRFDEIMPTTLSPKTKPEPASDAGIMMEQKLKMSEENSIIPIDLPKFEKKKSHPVFKLKRQGSLRIVAGVHCAMERRFFCICNDQKDTQSQHDFPL